MKMWERSIGSFDSLAVHLRRPAGREGFSVLLLQSGEPVAFVKLRALHSQRIDNERRALQKIGASGPTAFWVPTVLDCDNAGKWRYLALSPLPPRIHCVARNVDLQDLCEQITSSLATDTNRPSNLERGWVPIHGDLTPWNLRRIDSSVVIIDWEDTTWGPPDADLLWHDTVVSALDLDVPTSGYRASKEAYEFWLNSLTIRNEAQSQQTLAIRDHLLRERPK